MAPGGLLGTMPASRSHIQSWFLCLRPAQGTGQGVPLPRRHTNIQPQAHAELPRKVWVSRPPIRSCCGHPHWTRAHLAKENTWEDRGPPLTADMAKMMEESTRKLEEREERGCLEAARGPYLQRSQFQVTNLTPWSLFFLGALHWPEESRSLVGGSAHFNLVSPQLHP